jgi:probable rRNA maturation factor
MLEETIDFETEDINFELTNYQQVSEWINQVIHKHDYQLGALTYIFCSDEYLHQINLDYLDHDTYTDIITFDNADEEGIIEGDIFVSIDRVKENAQDLNVSFDDELHRVLIHGVLHLLGFDDTTPELKNNMREKENESLHMRNF